jgi:hypothetical protein
VERHAAVLRPRAQHLQTVGASWSLSERTSNLGTARWPAPPLRMAYTSTCSPIGATLNTVM